LSGILCDVLQRDAVSASSPHLRQEDAELIVTTIFDQITAALARGERVELRGFGAFTMRRRGARIGHNPRAREVVAVKEKTAQLNAEPWLVFRKYFARLRLRSTYGCLRDRS
jgi:nucleoid DNA-binding protein